MDSSLEALAAALDELAAKVTAAWADDRSVREVYGWNHAALTRHELAAIATTLAQRIRDAGPDAVEGSLHAAVVDMPRRLRLMHPDVVPHMFNGNGAAAIPVYVETLTGL